MQDVKFSVGCFLLSCVCAKGRLVWGGVMNAPSMSITVILHLPWDTLKTTETLVEPRICFYILKNVESDITL